MNCNTFIIALYIYSISVSKHKPKKWNAIT